MRSRFDEQLVTLNNELTRMGGRCVKRRLLLLQRH